MGNDLTNYGDDSPGDNRTSRFASEDKPSGLIHDQYLRDFFELLRVALKRGSAQVYTMHLQLRHQPNIDTQCPTEVDSLIESRSRLRRRLCFIKMRDFGGWNQSARMRIDGCAASQIFREELERKTSARAEQRKSEWCSLFDKLKECFDRRRDVSEAKGSL